jgi:hypothetical protein
MKRVVKAMIRPFWQLLAPLRRKVRAKVEGLFAASLQDALRKTGLMKETVGPELDEILVAIDSLVIEVYRLQQHVEELKVQLEEQLENDPGGLRRAG